MKYIIDTDKLPCNNGQNCTSCPFWSVDDTCEINEQVKELPKYEERPHGEWVYHRFDHDYECSICNLRLDEDEDMPAGDLWDYCPRCGARCLPMIERRAEDEND